MSLAKTITKVLKPDGTWYTFNWPQLGNITAALLHFIPNSADTPMLEGPELSELGISVATALDGLATVEDLIRHYASMGGVSVEHADGKALVSALTDLNSIRHSGWVSLQVKFSLPTRISAIARTVSTANALRAKANRPNADRRGRLRIAVENHIRQSTDDSENDVYNHLRSAGIIVDRPDGQVRYRDANGEVRSVSASTFSKICSQARKAKARGRRPARKNPYPVS